MPDHQDEATFPRARLNHKLREEGQHRILLEFYRELVKLRKEMPALSHPSKETQEVRDFEREKLLFILLFILRWTSGDNGVIMVYNLSGNQVAATLPIPARHWQKRPDSAEARWQGKGSLISEQLDSTGEVALTLNLWAFFLISKEI
jgi:maltooligosyltrehalose trehalohydrolase